MTNTVIHMIHCVDKEFINRLFNKFAIRYRKLWTTSLGEDGDWALCADDWLDELSKFSLNQVRAAVNKALTIYRNFPPNLGQLIDLCLAESGVPEIHQIINLMVRREFNHPLVKMVYDKIGSWTLSNGKEIDIQNKSKAVYSECLAEFTINPQACWKQLEAYNSKPKELPAPEKIPNQSERKGFKERMAEYYQKLEELKVNVEGKTYKEFDERKLKKGGRDFDPAVFNEYRNYLLSIPDTEIMILPPSYLCDRMKLIGIKEQPEMLKKQGYVPTKDRDESNLHKESYRKGCYKKSYKTWVND